MHFIQDTQLNGHYANLASLEDASGHVPFGLDLRAKQCLAEIQVRMTCHIGAMLQRAGAELRARNLPLYSNAAVSKGYSKA